MIYIARINRALGNYNKSQAFATTAVKLDPESTAANKELGLAYYYLGMQKEANKYLQRYLNLDPMAPDRSEIMNFMQ